MIPKSFTRRFSIMAMSTFLLLGAHSRSDEKPGRPTDTFLVRDGVISYTGRGLSVQSRDDLGWASLQVNGAEFLYSSDQVGGFLYSDQNPLAETPPLFPDLSNLSHDTMAGHLGMVANGIHMIRISANPKDDDYELYFGANSDTEGLQCTLFLSDKVVEIRLDDGQVIKTGTNETVSTRKAVLVHESGTELVIESTPPRDGKGEPPPFTAGRVTHPSGAELLALVFDTPGFKANPFRMSFDTAPRGPNLVGKAHFEVYSSDDPENYPRASSGVATFGVVNPEYRPDTQLDYGFVFEWKGSEPFDGHAELEVIHAYGTPHYYEKVDLSGKEPGQITGKFNPKFTIPGVSEVWLRIVDGEGRMLWNDRYRMMYDRENFTPNLLVEDDFESFWKDTLATLSEIPLEPETVRVEKYKDVPDFEIYAVSFNGWEGKRFHAMMYVPREGERPLPAIVTAHPGTRGFRINKGKDGVFGSDIREDKRFVTIIPFIRGHEIDAPDVPFNPPWWGPLEDRDTYAARSWYTAMVRAVDYLATRPDLVDIDRVVAAGGSQGGALAIALTALDPRIAHCFADCPSNAQAHEIMRYYESFGPSFGVIPEGSTREAAETLLSYFNPVNLAALIRVPTHVGINIGDITVHSMGPLSIYKNLTGLDEHQKAFHPGFSHFHGSGPGLTRVRNTIFQQLHQRTP